MTDLIAGEQTRVIEQASPAAWHKGCTACHLRLLVQMVIGLEEPKEDKAKEEGFSPADGGDLLAAHAGLAGTSAAHKEHYQLTVSNAAGYLCHIHLEARYSCSPDLIFRILSNPGASAHRRYVL